ncbi:endolytic transglycosylase MltG [Nocardia stercoris]|uniref:Endolytic murein transglycosylase n=1 Tax=Nocardia stercoris TaxID=2483361 RepID=A0A3M2L279_9NOCA|nr:endolytic transglycosylase MltG [Nocardia stercoris]RMI30633.1 endolytic transglycosylase MltG [Nocardia stercoris]
MSDRRMRTGRPEHTGRRHRYADEPAEPESWDYDEPEWDEDDDWSPPPTTGRRHRAEPDDWDDEPPAHTGSRHAAATSPDEWDTNVLPVYVDDDQPPVGFRAHVDPPAAEELTDPHLGPVYRDPEPEPQPRSRAGDDQRSAPRRVGRSVPAAERGGKGRPGGKSRRSRAASRKAAERRRRRRTMWLSGTVLAVLFVVAAGYAGWKLIAKLNGPEDFSGPTGPLVVVQVHSGDTASEIAKTAVDKGVVASTGAFYQAAARNSQFQKVQPGYYALPTHSRGEDAVTAMVGKDARVGNVVISDGRRLHDSNDVNTGARNEGIYRKIADASCLGTGADRKCVTYEQLDQAGASTDLAALGVPAWASDSVRGDPDRTRQLEGLIGAGTWDFDPSATPTQILNQLVTESVQSYEASGLLQSGNANGLNPYQTLIGASLVEREALPQDMTKVARVIVNRLAAQQPLQFDSTVNYTLDTTEVATTDSDRAHKTPWNTYAMSGLPLTPISSPSAAALKAMESPAPGPWLYFVTVDKQGDTKFTDSYSEHLHNISLAQQNGVLDSGR